MTVIGVMPPGFEFPRGYLIWAQFVEDVTQMPRQGRFLGVIGRLKEGVSFAAAESDLQLIASRLEAQYPNANRGIGVTMMRYRDVVLGDLGSQLWILLAAAGVLLLIACVNVANLLLARGAARNLEIALRAALGAGRWRITRQLLTESIVMAGLGAIGAGREDFEEVGTGVALVVAIDAGADSLSRKAKGDEDDPALALWALGFFALSLGLVRFLLRQGDAGNANAKVGEGGNGEFELLMVVEGFGAKFAWRARHGMEE